jgi:hypothetical protein
VVAEEWQLSWTVARAADLSSHGLLGCLRINPRDSKELGVSLPPPLTVPRAVVLTVRGRCSVSAMLDGLPARDPDEQLPLLEAASLQCQSLQVTSTLPLIFTCQDLHSAIDRWQPSTKGRGSLEASVCIDVIVCRVSHRSCFTRGVIQAVHVMVCGPMHT